MTRREECKILASRLGLTTNACLAWMNANRIDAITDLIGRWPDLDHAQAMQRAGDEIWAHHMATQ